MRILRHTEKWWRATTLLQNPVYLPKNHRSTDPAGQPLSRRLQGKVGFFRSSNSWLYYNALPSVDAGYLVPLYDLKAIGLRYGLSQNAQRYFKKHLLPEPHDIVRRRSVASHHWSKFTLMVLDVTLKDLERLGYPQFLKRFTEHIDNVQHGVTWMEQYYTEKHEEQLPLSGDQFGVSWETD